MDKSNREWTGAKFERFCKEWRGQGIGKDYLPWITIRDFPSLGRPTRISGWKTNQVHQLLSDREKPIFYL